MAKKLTNFVRALSSDTVLRDKYRDPAKRGQLLEQWGLEDHPALQEGAPDDAIENAVRAENGTKQVEWWIRSAGAPEFNTEYDFRE